jgi:hypothetical protein
MKSKIKNNWMLYIIIITIIIQKETSTPLSFAALSSMEPIIITPTPK